MAYLMHIAFDNPVRLRRNTYYFEYRGVRFKLIQNSRKWADVLLTIVADYQDASVAPALDAAGEFASAFGWVHNVGVPVRHIGGPGIPDSFRLRQARCRSFAFPEIPFRGRHVGYSLSRIAKIDSKDQRIGLTLFREARSANKTILSLLLFWQILEIRHNPVAWTNRVVRREPRILAIVQESLSRLPLAGRSLGAYLLEDCRHAIAHIKRKPGRRVLKFDDDTESARLRQSERVAERLAEHYIRAELNVTNHLFLARKRGRGFPTFLDEATIRAGWYTGIREPAPRFFGAA